MKKTLVTMIVSLALIGGGSSVSSASSLTDVNGHWGKEQIDFAIKEGFVDGYPDGTFKPDQEISRVEFMKLVVDALKIKKGAETKEWYQPYMDAAVANGLHVANEFAAGQLNDPITREEVARIAVRATGQTNTDSKKWMYLATSKGIINGTDEKGTLGPNYPTTRAQAVTVIRRIVKIREGASLPVDKYAVSAAEVYWHKTNAITMLPRYFSKIKQNGTFRDDLMKSSAWDGNVACSVDQYVVVDMDDPNDPNRKLVRDGLKVFNPDGTIQEISGSNYILVSQQTIDIKKYPKNTLSISGCRAAIIDQLYDDTGTLEAKGAVSASAGLGSYTEDENGRKIFDKSNRFMGKEGDQTTATTYTYQIVPKGDMKSTNSSSRTFRMGFYGIDAPSPTVIYEGFINHELQE